MRFSRIVLYLLLGLVVLVGAAKKSGPKAVAAKPKATAKKTHHAPKQGARGRNWADKGGPALFKKLEAAKQPTSGSYQQLKSRWEKYKAKHGISSSSSSSSSSSTSSSSSSSSDVGNGTPLANNNSEASNTQPQQQASSSSSSGNQQPQQLPANGTGSCSSQEQHHLPEASSDHPINTSTRARRPFKCSTLQSSGVFRHPRSCCLKEAPVSTMTPTVSRNQRRLQELRIELANANAVLDECEDSSDMHVRATLLKEVDELIVEIQLLESTSDMDEGCDEAESELEKDRASNVSWKEGDEEEEEPQELAQPTDEELDEEESDDDEEKQD